MNKLWCTVRGPEGHVVYGDWVVSVTTNELYVCVTFKEVGYLLTHAANFVTEQALVERMPKFDGAFYDPEVMVFITENNTTEYVSLPESVASYFAYYGMLYWDDYAGVYKVAHPGLWADITSIINQASPSLD